MAENIKMDTSKLRKSCQEFESGLKELKKSLQEMKESVDRLNATWEGPSHDDFVKNYEKDYQQMEALNKGLEQYLEALWQAQRDYTACEEQVGELVRGL